MEEEKQDSQGQKVRVRYEETLARFASQFLINTTDEDVIINFSSGHIADPGQAETMLPVHTRIAMSLSGAARLHAVLGKILQDKGLSQGRTSSVPEDAKARLPKMTK